MEERNYCVYKHTSPSNKVYIGITCQEPEKRWKNGNGYQHNKYFTNAIKRYGWENFTHEVLFTNLTKEEACEKEIELIAFYKSSDREFGYNQSTGGEYGNNGSKGHHWKLSDETKKKISESKLGCSSCWAGKQLPEEMKNKIAANHSHYWQGKKMSEEHKRKISEGNKGRIVSVETRKKISEFKKGEKHHMFGKNHSEEARKKISENSAAPKVAAAYKKYKANGGLLKWNEFQKEYTNLNIAN